MISCSKSLKLQENTTKVNATSKPKYIAWDIEEE